MITKVINNLGQGYSIFFQILAKSTNNLGVFGNNLGVKNCVINNQCVMHYRITLVINNLGIVCVLYVICMVKTEWGYHQGYPSKVIKPLRTARGRAATQPPAKGGFFQKYVVVYCGSNTTGCWVLPRGGGFRVAPRQGLRKNFRFLKIRCPPSVMR